VCDDGTDETGGEVELAGGVDDEEGHHKHPEEVEVGRGTRDRPQRPVGEDGAEPFGELSSASTGSRCGRQGRHRCVPWQASPEPAPNG
jgi:hypothetical protein